MDAEDADKILQFLDLNIKKVERKYVTSIYRKKAITKVQVKPHPMILKGIFTGYIHRAYAICQPIQREEEINFLIRCFTENRYNNNKLKRIINHDSYLAMDTRTESYEKAFEKQVIKLSSKVMPTLRDY